MKVKKGVVRVLAVALAVLVVAGVVGANTPQKRTLRYFNAHRAVLDADIAATLASGALTNSLKITCNYWDSEHPIVEYIVTGTGLAPASKYYGFFYSFDGVPVCFQNAGETLVPVARGEWRWQGEGDNHGTVRVLDGNWFSFVAAL